MPREIITLQLGQCGNQSKCSMLAIGGLMHPACTRETHRVHISHMAGHAGGKSSKYDVHQFSSLAIISSPEIDNRSEKSILAMTEYNHFQ